MDKNLPIMDKAEEIRLLQYTMAVTELIHVTKWRLSYASFLFSIYLGYCLAGCCGC